mmetsp:Transcript_20545/g.32131  ORF Transcript_20545/g.32131 Transcript_20545/m.32131 type:complete len:212 (-) Transcript_20545:342-977(-)
MNTNPPSRGPESYLLILPGHPRILPIPPSPGPSPCPSNTPVASSTAKTLAHYDPDGLVSGAEGCGFRFGARPPHSSRLSKSISVIRFSTLEETSAMLGKIVPKEPHRGTTTKVMKPSCALAWPAGVSKLFMYPLSSKLFSISRPYCTWNSVNTPLPNSYATSGSIPWPDKSAACTTDRIKFTLSSTLFTSKLGFSNWIPFSIAMPTSSAFS